METGIEVVRGARRIFLLQVNRDGAGNGRALGQRVADIRENGIYRRRNVPDAAHCGQSNQRDQQCVFDQILTFFVLEQALDL